jgi:hypothetical protein
MQTLTDQQKKIAVALIDYAHDRISEGADSLLIEEAALAKLIDQPSWKRSNVDDLNALSAFCDRKGYPPVSLLVVIPGLMRPEKSVLIHAFKATLPAAEFAKRWAAALEEIKVTPDDAWEVFRFDITDCS